MHSFFMCYQSSSHGGLSLFWNFVEESTRALCFTTTAAAAELTSPPPTCFFSLILKLKDNPSSARILCAWHFPLSLGHQSSDQYGMVCHFVWPTHFVTFVIVTTFQLLYLLAFFFPMLLAFGNVLGILNRTLADCSHSTVHASGYLILTHSFSWSTKQKTYRFQCLTQDLNHDYQQILST